MPGRVVPCAGCGQPLGNEDIALSVKLSGLSAPRLLCLNCQAAETGAGPKELAALIIHFKKSGCVHFQRDYLS